MSMVLVEPRLNLSFLCYRLNGLTIFRQVPERQVLCEHTSSPCQASSDTTCIVEFVIVKHPISSVGIGHKSYLDVVSYLVTSILKL